MQIEQFSQKNNFLNHFIPTKEISLPVVEKKVEKVEVEEKPVIKEEPKIAPTSTKSLDRIREIKEKRKNKVSATVSEQVDNKENEIVQQVENTEIPVDANSTDNVETLDKSEDKKEELNYESL